MMLHNHQSLGIALQLWNCCHKDLQTMLRSKSMRNFTEEETVAKMKVVIVTMQNVLVYVTNFLCLRQQKAKIIYLYLGHIKGATSNENFNNAKNHMGMVGVLPNPGSFYITHQCSKHPKCKNMFYILKFTTKEPNIPTWSA